MAKVKILITKLYILFKLTNLIHSLSEKGGYQFHHYTISCKQKFLSIQLCKRLVGENFDIKRAKTRIQFLSIKKQFFAPITYLC